MSRWTAAEITLLRTARQRGDTVAEISAELGRTEGMIRCALVRHGLTVPVRHADGERFRRLYNRGYSDGDIGLKTGYAMGTVNKWRREAGLPAHGQHSQRSRAKFRRNAKRMNSEDGLPLRLRAKLDDMARAGEHGWAVPLTRYERRYCSCLLAGPLTVAELAEQVGHCRKYAEQTARKLCRRGALTLVERHVKEKVYALAEQARRVPA